MTQESRQGWGPTSVSAGVLSLASFGDALIYVVLPVSAAAFGVNLVWVGVLLAVNRIVRIFLYGPIAAIAEAIGPRMLAIVSAVAAVISTLMIWALTGGPLLLVARIIWGLAFAGLSLSALAYAVADKSRAGSRVGVSRSIQQMGPALALSAGAWLAGLIGPREIFLVLGLASLLAIPLAFWLPKESSRPTRKKTRWLPRPIPIDIFFFVVGFVVDGVFAMTVALVLTKTVSAETAMLGAGFILAFRRLGEIFLAPVAGWIGDQFGTARVLVISTFLLAGGFAFLAADWAYVGSALVIVARAAIAAVGPAAVAQSAHHSDTLYRLAVMQTWRDFGAAVGPLVTGALLEVTGLGVINSALVIVVLLSLTALWGIGKQIQQQP